MLKSELLIFDTGPLSHFSREGWLGALKAVVGERTALVPDLVVDELRRGLATNSHLQVVLDAPWIGRHELRSPSELEQFANFSSLLVARDRNVGEAGVLALAATSGGTAIVDDLAGRKAAKNHGVRCTGTLGLLVSAIREGLLTVPLVSALADDLIAGDYRLPFKPGEFAAWAAENGLPTAEPKPQLPPR